MRDYLRNGRANFGGTTTGFWQQGLDRDNALVLKVCGQVLNYIGFCFIGQQLGKFMLIHFFLSYFM